MIAAEEIAAMRPDCLRYARSLRLSPDEDAEDYVQQTMMLAIRSRHTFRSDTGDTSLVGWLFCILRNFRRDHLSKSNRHTLVESVEPFCHTTAMPRADTMVQLEEAILYIKKMRPKKREILLAAAAADGSYKEIAAQLGIPRGTVQSRLSRARDALRSGLDAAP